MDQKSIQTGEVASIKIETEVSHITIPAEQLHSLELLDDGVLQIRTTKEAPFDAEI